jgi:AraC-like DNA-binding protein
VILAFDNRYRPNFTGRAVDDPGLSTMRTVLPPVTRADDSALGTSADVHLTPVPGITIELHYCHTAPGPWSLPAQLRQHALVFVRDGGFRIRLNGREDYLSSASIYFEGGGGEYQTQHPRDGGDTTVMFFFTEGAFRSLVPQGRIPQFPLISPADLDLAQRRLLIALEHGLDRFEAEERITQLVNSVLDLGEVVSPSVARAATDRSHERIVRFVKEAIAANPAGVSLGELAAGLGCSPSHVCRVFSQRVGMSMSRFRNRLRVANAISRLEQGDVQLASLANQLGFADQAHMTRVVRAELGTTPRHAQMLLHGVQADGDGNGNGARQSAGTGAKTARA